MMKNLKTALLSGALVVGLAAGTAVATSAAAATTYVVCNRYDTCWKVQERYKDYPADLGVTYHDEAWWAAHEHDSGWRFQTEERTDHGWYDQHGDWHSIDHPDHP